MTFSKLKSAAKLFLTGDTPLPKDDEQLIVSVEIAYLFIADHTTSLKLLTTNKEEEIIRRGPGGQYIRMPNLPEFDDDYLDIDKELYPAVARLMASHVSRDKSEYHQAKAMEIITAYESKVESYILEQERLGKYSQYDIDSSDDGTI